MLIPCTNGASVRRVTTRPLVVVETINVSSRTLPLPPSVTLIPRLLRRSRALAPWQGHRCVDYNNAYYAAVALLRCFFYFRTAASGTFTGKFLHCFFGGTFAAGFFTVIRTAFGQLFLQQSCCRCCLIYPCLYFQRQLFFIELLSMPLSSFSISCLARSRLRTYSASMRSAPRR